MASDITVSGKVSDKQSAPMKAEEAVPVAAVALQPVVAPSSMPVAPVVRVFPKDAEVKATLPKAQLSKGDAAKIEAPKAPVLKAKVPAPKATTSKSAAAKLDLAAPGATKSVFTPKAQTPVVKKALAFKPKASKPAAKAAQPADALRTIAEQSLTQARMAFTKSHEATESFAKGMESSREVVQAGLKEMQLRMAVALEAQTHAAFGLFRAMTQVHSLSEAIEVQSSAMRHGVQRTMGEAKEISSLAQAIASKATEPVRKAFDHAISVAHPRH